MAAPKKPEAAPKNEDAVKIRILTATKIKDVAVKANQVVETDAATAKSLIESGAADDSEEAVAYALEAGKADVISI